MYAFFAFLYSSGAYANVIEAPDITTRFIGFIQKFTNFFSAIFGDGNDKSNVLPFLFLVLTAIFLFVTLLKFREHAVDPRTKLSIPISYFIATLIFGNAGFFLAVTTSIVSTSSACDSSAVSQAAGTQKIDSFNNLLVSGMKNKENYNCFRAYNISEGSFPKTMEKISKVNAGENDATQILITLLNFFKFIGIIYFIYGILQIPKIATSQGQITAAKPITHILASSVLINMPMLIEGLLGMFTDG